MRSLSFFLLFACLLAFFFFCVGQAQAQVFEYTTPYYTLTFNSSMFLGFVFNFTTTDTATSSNYGFGFSYSRTLEHYVDPAGNPHVVHAEYYPPNGFQYSNGTVGNASFVHAVGVLSNGAILDWYFYVYYQEADIPYAGQVLHLAPYTLKFSVNVTNWPFLANSSNVAVWNYVYFENFVPAGLNDTSAITFDSITGSIVQIRLGILVNGTAPFYVNIPQQCYLDGNISTIFVGGQNPPNNGGYLPPPYNNIYQTQIEFKFPIFKQTGFYDPDIGTLVSVGDEPGSSSNTGGSSTLALEIAVPVGTVAVVAVVAVVGAGIGITIWLKKRAARARLSGLSRTMRSLDTPDL